MVSFIMIVITVFVFLLMYALNRTFKLSSYHEESLKFYDKAFHTLKEYEEKVKIIEIMNIAGKEAPSFFFTLLMLMNPFLTVEEIADYETHGMSSKIRKIVSELNS